MNILPRRIRTIKDVPHIDGVWQFAVPKGKIGSLRHEPGGSCYVFDEGTAEQRIIPWLHAEWVKDNLGVYVEEVREGAAVK